MLVDIRRTFVLVQAPRGGHAPGALRKSALWFHYACRVLSTSSVSPACNETVPTDSILVPMAISSYASTVSWGTWRASMDEGWTRYLFDTHRVPYENVTNEQVREGKIDNFDVLLLADISPDIIKEGEPSGESARLSRPLPPDYQGGIGNEGMENLKKFVAEGGTLICFGRSCDLAIEALELPMSNVLDKVSADDFYGPGSILEVSFREGHPVTYGMREKGHIFFTNSPAFATAIPFGKYDRTVLATYESKNPLASGLLIGAERLHRRAALVEVTYDEGKVILFGFRPQHRCQTAGTYKLIFNALIENGKE